MQGAAFEVILDGDEYDSLKRKLAIRARSLGFGADRGSKQASDAPLDEREGGEDAQADILASYRQGARIAPQTESRPLIPLFAAAGKPLPPEMQVDHEQLGYCFYSIEVAFTVVLPPGQFPLSAELGLRLTDDVADPARRARPIQLFPGHRDVTYFRANVEGAVGIDASMKLALPTTVAGIPLPFADVSADAKLKANLVVGPFSFPICKAAVEVGGEQSQDIYWRYNMESELTGANTFKSVLILKVGQEARHVSLEGALKVTPYKPSWVLFKELLPALTHRVPLPVELVR